MVLLALGIVLVLIATVAGQVRLNLWQGSFYDALERKDIQAFMQQIVVFLAIISVLLTLAVGQTWLQEMIKVRLREWMTHDLLDEWLMGNRAYWMQFAGEIGINPDQRMQEDARHLTELSASLGIGFLQASLLLVSFLGVLWVLSEQVMFSLNGHSFSIPGYMVWCALAFATAGSWLSWWVGRPLIQLNYDRYSAEADLRFAMVRDNENAEGIALRDGEKDERKLFDGTIDRLIGVMCRLANGLARLTWVTSGYGWLALVAPILVAAPGYFGGSLSFGGLMMVVGAFFQVQQSLRWYVDNFAGIADWRATLSRIVNFRDALLKVDEMHRNVPRIAMSASASGNLVLDDVTLYLPNGQAALDAPHIEVAPGKHVLIVGGSGSGKTALVLAFAGLWPWGTGTIRMPAQESVLFLRERPYLPLGTLRSVMGYPAPPKPIDDAMICGALKQVGLEYLDASLDREERWDKTLALDEQQRLAFAHLLIYAPKWVFLDDALSALDEKQREELMAVFYGPLSGTTVISTSRMPEQDHFYNRTFNLRRLPGGERLPVQSKDSRNAAPDAIAAQAPVQA
ncbi:ABC transporter ATP-binding protein/permease [Stappia sediminis]|uniref:ABC transporter ATP-binding protein/permease n=1 Tax=Stappia sediminis TaxID=2692190 RepID=UPI00136AE6EA|nr:ABC transporter ATP-binding protein/permease [Stappia sediminis]